ncbi:ABC transporter permease [Desulfovibrio sp. OttesenSCG-928-G15]|nr:ABC transporter permease [Desulfovibrio sp. OttesenSCG-928-G15]
MNGSYKQALSLQGRVLWALCLREIHGKHGKSRLGYLWQFVKTGFTVAVFWFVRAATGFQTPYDIAVPLYLLMGIIPWFMFKESVSMVMEAVHSNEALLTFPQVSTLDLMLSSAIVAWVTELIVLLIYLFLIIQLGYKVSLVDPLALLGGMGGVCLMGLSVGMIFTAINLYVPVTEKLVPMLLRILFFTSGVFFTPTARFGAEYRVFFDWNPLTNYFELLRGAFVFSAPMDSVKIDFIFFVTIYALGVGLLLERYVRPKHSSMI